MDQNQLTGALAFLREAGKLKDVLRTAHTGAGRQESTAEHSWRLCLMALVFEAELPGIDFAKLLRLCVVHDLAEAVTGDIPAIHQQPDMNKSAREREALLSLLSPLPAPVAARFAALWEEYEAAATPEAKLAKGFDKLETLLQHNQGKNPADFDYAFNLTYGAKHTASPPQLAALRALLDAETAEHDAAWKRRA